MRGTVVQMQMMPCVCFRTDEPTPRDVWGWALVDDGVVQTVQPVVLEDGKMVVAPDERVLAYSVPL
jgi:hypothetical protein